MERKGIRLRLRRAQGSALLVLIELVVELHTTFPGTRGEYWWLCPRCTAVERPLVGLSLALPDEDQV